MQIPCTYVHDDNGPHRFSAISLGSGFDLGNARVTLNAFVVGKGWARGSADIQDRLSKRLADLLSTDDDCQALLAEYQTALRNASARL